MGKAETPPNLLDLRSFRSSLKSHPVGVTLRVVYVYIFNKIKSYFPGCDAKRKKEAEQGEEDQRILRRRGAVGSGRRIEY